MTHIRSGLVACKNTRNNTPHTKDKNASLASQKKTSQNCEQQGRKEEQKPKGEHTSARRSQLSSLSHGNTREWKTHFQRASKGTVNTVLRWDMFGPASALQVGPPRGGGGLRRWAWAVWSTGPARGAMTPLVSPVALPAPLLSLGLPSARVAHLILHLSIILFPSTHSKSGHAIP